MHSAESFSAVQSTVEYSTAPHSSAQCSKVPWILIPVVLSTPVSSQRSMIVLHPMAAEVHSITLRHRLKSTSCHITHTADHLHPATDRRTNGQTDRQTDTHTHRQTLLLAYQTLSEYGMWQYLLCASTLPLLHVLRCGVCDRIDFAARQRSRYTSCSALVLAALCLSLLVTVAVRDIS